MDNAQEAFARASVGILDDLFHSVRLFVSLFYTINAHLTECYRGDGYSKSKRRQERSNEEMTDSPCSYRLADLHTLSFSMII